MAAIENLRRLYRVREAEESTAGSALLAANLELHRLEIAMQSAGDRARQARINRNSSLQSANPVDWYAELEEITLADRVARVLSARIHAAREHTGRVREQFFEARVRRQQTETLLEQSISQALIEANRKSQIALDEWHRSRAHWTSSNRRQKTPESESPCDAPQPSIT